MNVIDALTQIISSGVDILRSVSVFIKSFLATIGIPEIITISGTSVNIYALASLITIIAILSALMKFFTEYSKYIFYIAIFSVLLLILSKILGG